MAEYGATPGGVLIVWAWLALAVTSAVSQAAGWGDGTAATTIAAVAVAMIHLEGLRTRRYLDRRLAEVSS